jgi:hypothetical protein
LRGKCKIGGTCGVHRVKPKKIVVPFAVIALAIEVDEMHDSEKKLFLSTKNRMRWFDVTLKIVVGIWRS